MKIIDILLTYFDYIFENDYQWKSIIHDHKRFFQFIFIVTSPSPCLFSDWLKHVYTPSDWEIAVKFIYKILHIYIYVRNTYKLRSWKCRTELIINELQCHFVQSLKIALPPVLLLVLPYLANTPPSLEKYANKVQ